MKDEIFSITVSEQKSLKNFCDLINNRLETEHGRKIVSNTTSSLRNGLIDKFHLITEESVKQMLVLHIATLPIFGALFGEGAKYNPVTMILNAATNEILNIREGSER